MTWESNPSGLCRCGCGDPAPIARRNRYDIDHLKGEPVDFIHGHSGKGENNGNWAGGRHYVNGYVRVLAKGHPHANYAGYALEHLVVAAAALGKPVPPEAVVHHVNGVKDDNRPENLVICEDRAYHALLHVRADALRETGDPDKRLCVYCGEYDDPESPEMAGITSSRRSAHHYECRRTYRRAA